ncbi:MAG: diadenylate cyclase [Puniceicoccales bacterium]|nr:diadenylate cyclase [Puniceicoccales bacterium]
MKLSHYIENSSMIDIKSTTFKGALEELIQCYPLKKKRNLATFVEELLIQENTVSSYLGQGIALPHLKVPMQKAYLFAFGRVRTPLQDATINGSENIRLIVLFLAASKTGNYLTTLASLAKILQSTELTHHLNDISLEELRFRILDAFKTVQLRSAKTNDRFNRLMLRESLKIAKAGNCSALFLFVDTFFNTTRFIKELNPDLKVITVTHKASEVAQKDSTYILPVQLFSNGRLTQLRSAILLGIMHKCIRHNEKICCIGGIPNSNRLDTVLIIDVNREIQSLFSNQADILPKNVQPEVFEKLLSIATELAVEGREGKPVGCLFILGDVQELAPYVYPLILNPFHGYKEEDRNLLNPFIEETIKEYSLLDGAFVIGGNGILESAGSLIHTKDQISLPSGFGTRHSAALAISNTVDCIALTVSASNGQVTLFRKGKMLPLIEKGIGHTHPSTYLFE